MGVRKKKLAFFYGLIKGEITCRKTPDRYGNLIHEQTCICMGGDLKVCGGCKNMIQLHDEPGHYVMIKKCPFHDNDYGQERHILRVYNHYKNGHLFYPLNNTPEWVDEGIAILSRIDAAISEAERGH